MTTQKKDENGRFLPKEQTSAENATGATNETPNANPDAPIADNPDAPLPPEEKPSENPNKNAEPEPDENELAALTMANEIAELMKSGEVTNIKEYLNATYDMEPEDVEYIANLTIAAYAKLVEPSETDYALAAKNIVAGLIMGGIAQEDAKEYIESVAPKYNSEKMLEIVLESSETIWPTPEPKKPINTKKKAHEKAVENDEVIEIDLNAEVDVEAVRATDSYKSYMSSIVPGTKFPKHEILSEITREMAACRKAANQDKYNYWKIIYNDITPIMP